VDPHYTYEVYEKKKGKWQRNFIEDLYLGLESLRKGGYKIQILCETCVGIKNIIE